MTTIQDELGIPRARGQRRELSPRDGATIDQLQGGLSEAFDIMRLPGQTAAARHSGADGAGRQDARTQTLLDDGMINQTTANSVEHCVQELRMAMVGLIK